MVEKMGYLQVEEGVNKNPISPILCGLLSLLLALARREPFV